MLSILVHALGHLQNNKASNGMTGHQARMAIEKLHLKEIAKMAKSFPASEGNGTMLDNTLIVYVCPLGTTTARDMTGHCYFLVGWTISCKLDAT